MVTKQPSLYVRIVYALEKIQLPQPDMSTIGANAVGTAMMIEPLYLIFSTPYFIGEH